MASLLSRSQPPGFLNGVSKIKCYLCGDKFASEIGKDFHMGTCDKADGPNSLDSNCEDPVRGLYLTYIFNSITNSLIILIFIYV